MPILSHDDSAAVASYDQFPTLSRTEVEILHEIVLEAQDAYLTSSHPKKVLFDAYDSVFAAHGFDTNQDRSCLRVLLQLAGPMVPGDTLYGKFERLLRQAGIELQFDDDDGLSITQPQYDTDTVYDETEPQDVPDFKSISRRVGRRASFTSMSDFQRPKRPEADEEPRKEQGDDPTPQYLSTMADAAEKMFAERRMRKYLKQMADRNREVANLYANAIEKDALVLKSQTLEVWQSFPNRNEGRERADMDRAASVEHHNLKDKAFYHWRAVFDDRKQAREDQAKVSFLRHRIDKRLLGDAVKAWVIEERGNLFLRIREARIRQCFLRKLVDSFHALRISLHHSEAVAVANRNTSLCRPALQALQVVARTTAEHWREAVLVDECHLEQSTLSMMREKSRHWDRQRERADEYRGHVLVWPRFHKWKKKGMESKLRRLNEKYKVGKASYKRRLASRHLHKLIASARSIAENKQVADDFRTRLTTSYTSKMITSWGDQMRSWERAGKDADQMFDRAIMNLGLGALTLRASQMAASLRTADQFWAIHEQEVARSTLHVLGRRAFEMSRRRADALALRDRLEGQRLSREAMQRLRNAFRAQIASRHGSSTVPAPAPVTPMSGRQRLMASLVLGNTPATQRPRSFASRLREQTPAELVEVESRIEEFDDDD